ncbi:tetratricopeptide repeat protein [candidate division KSB1 bacterium]|nr:MAG: tetratricopeptide repeat protein [candidate division KSB1 bacterium]
MRRVFNYIFLIFILLFHVCPVADAQVDPFKIVKDEDLDKEASKIFDKALSLYRNAEYWQSSRELISLIDEYPNFSQTAQAVYTLANCLYELNMMEGAFKLYERIIKRHITSSYVPDALLGLQRIEYERDNYSASLDYYGTLTRGNPSTAIIDLANYYAGMAYYKLADYPRAVKVFSQVSAKSPYYDYVLYTLAISMLRMQSINPAIQVYMRLFDLPVINDERRQVIDEAHLTLGYLYYEIGYFDQAIEQFRAVSPSSSKFPHALLAMGWAASQKNDWLQAIPPLTELYTRYETSELTQEGLFLLGRSYLKLNRYDEAIRIYDHLIHIFPEQDQVILSIETINENIKLERQRIEKRQLELLVLEGNLVDDLNVNAQIKRRNLSQEQTVLLRDIQRERQELTEHLSQLDKLATMTMLREERRNWRAYAEYGKSRATFLKRQQERRQKIQNENN